LTTIDPTGFAVVVNVYLMGVTALEPTASVEPDASSVTGLNPPRYGDLKLSHSIPNAGAGGVSCKAAVGNAGQLASIWVLAVLSTQSSLTVRVTSYTPTSLGLNTTEFCRDAVAAIASGALLFAQFPLDTMHHSYRFCCGYGKIEALVSKVTVSNCPI
jgi:hypothetical protein